TWQQGVTYCAGTVDGTTGWRLPYLWELSKYFYQNGRGDFQSGYYWSGTNSPQNPGYACIVAMFDGNVVNYTKSNASVYVRCAR
ncbi:MAG: hypothetical protein NTU76_00740, partial [Candidatus Taylorbacteria bacterium]|nr:hypothetical protein [Candidatus Taylorbacteria bacterium]